MPRRHRHAAAVSPDGGYVPAPARRCGADTPFLTSSSTRTGTGGRKRSQARLLLVAVVATTLSHASTPASAQVLELQVEHELVTSEFETLEAVARSSARFIEMLGPAGASPSMLERIVLSNVLNTDVFGSAIAFEPGSYPVVSPPAGPGEWDVTEGVRSPIGSNTDPATIRHGSTSVTGVPGELLYCPYAYRGGDWIAGNGTVLTIDIAFAYDYTEANTDWYLDPLETFSATGDANTGTWSAPYHDANAGNINMTTFSLPIRSLVNLTNAETGQRAAVTRSAVEDVAKWAPPSEVQQAVADVAAQQGITVGEVRTLPIWFWGVVTVDVPLSEVRQWVPWPYPDSLFVSVVSVAVLLAVLVIATIVLVIRNRKHPVLRAVSPNLSLVTLVGLLALAPAGTLFVVEPAADNNVCQARVAVSSMALMTVIAPIVAKTWRIAVLFDNPKMRRVKLPDSRVMLRALILIAVQAVLTLFWVLPPGTPSYAPLRRRIDEPTVQYLQEPRCTDKLSLQWISFVFGACAIVFGAYVSYRSRSAPDAFNESRHIFLCIAFTTVYAALLVPVQLLIRDDISAALMLRGMGLLIGALIVLVAMFAPVVFHLMQAKADDKSVGGGSSGGISGGARRGKGGGAAAATRRGGASAVVHRRAEAGSGGAGGRGHAHSSNGNGVGSGARTVVDAGSVREGGVPRASARRSQRRSGNRGSATAGVGVDAADAGVQLTTEAAQSIRRKSEQLSLVAGGVPSTAGSASAAVVGQDSRGLPRARAHAANGGSSATAAPTRSRAARGSGGGRVASTRRPVAMVNPLLGRGGSGVGVGGGVGGDVDRSDVHDIGDPRHGEASAPRMAP